MLLTLTSLASTLFVQATQSVIIRPLPALIPRSHITHDYLDACSVLNCTLIPDERAQCLLDCPPLAGPTASAYGSHPTPQPGFANFSILTYTQTVTKIPDYCLPGGPAAPIANVPTISLPEGDVFTSDLAAALETVVPSATEAASESEAEAVTEAPVAGPAPTPAIVTASSAFGANSENSTSPTYFVGPLASPTETPLEEVLTGAATRSRASDGFMIFLAVAVGLALGYTVYLNW